LTDPGPGEVGQQEVIAAAQVDPVLVAALAATDVQARAKVLEALHHAVDQVHGEGQFPGRVHSGRQRRAQQIAALFGRREGDIGQHRFVELHEVASGRAQVLQFLAQQGHHVPSQRLLVGVVRRGQVLDPGRAGQEVRAGQRDLDGAVGQAAHPEEFVDGQRDSALQATHHDGDAHGPGRDLTGLQESFEKVGVMHVPGQFVQAQQAQAVHPVGDERVEVRAGLLAIADHVHAALLLQADGRLDRGPDLQLQPGLGQLAAPGPVHGEQEALGAGQAAYDRDGEQRHLAHGSARLQAGFRSLSALQAGGSCPSRG